MKAYDIREKILAWEFRPVCRAGLSARALRDLGWKDGRKGNELSGQFAHLPQYRTGWFDGFTLHHGRFSTERRELVISSLKECAQAIIGEVRWRVRVRGVEEWQLIVRAPSWYAARHDASKAFRVDAHKLEVQRERSPWEQALLPFVAPVYGLVAWMLTKK